MGEYLLSMLSMKQKVLIIDDEKDTCLLLSHILKGMGYETQYCHSLNEGKLKFAAIKPDVIFLDIHLPDGNGLEEVPGFRTLDPKVLIMIISAFDSPGELRKAQKFEVSAFIMKPFKREQVVSALQNIAS